MNRKWKKMWTDAFITVFVGTIYAAVVIGSVYLISGLVSLLYRVLIGG